MLSKGPNDQKTILWLLSNTFEKLKVNWIDVNAFNVLHASRIWVSEHHTEGSSK
jgi:hypothetical protein